MGSHWFGVYVYPVLPNGLERGMIWLTCLCLLAFSIVAAVLFAEYEEAEDERIKREIEDDYNYFLQTGDDAGYKRRMKK